MSWTGNYWGPQGALAQAKETYDASGRTAADIVAYASVNYSAANRVMTDIRQPRLDFFHRLKQGLDLGWKAVALVDQAWVRQNPVSGYWVTRYDAIDVSCAIWLRWGWIVGGRKAAVGLALRSVAWREYEGIESHTKAFLLLHSVKVGSTQLDADLCEEIESLASQTAARGALGQASRICKYLAGLVSAKSYQKQLLLEAKIYAQRGQASDQLAKLGHATNRV